MAQAGIDEHLAQRIIDEDRALAHFGKSVEVREAAQRIGELPRDLDKAQGARSDRRPLPSAGKKLKTKALADAGMRASSAG